MTKKRLQNKVKRQNQKINELETLIKNTCRALSNFAAYESYTDDDGNAHTWIWTERITRRAFKRTAERVQERLSEIDEKYKSTV